MKLMLVRHGETASNLRMALDSLPPGPPLTDLGQEQANLLADALADEPVVAVYASTAVRAQQTAAPIAARHGMAVQVVEGVQEIFCGDLEGRSDREAYGVFVKTATAWAAGDLDLMLPGGENGRQVVDRCTGAIAAITEGVTEGTVVLVSHGGAIRLTGQALAPNVTSDLAAGGLLPNTGRVVLESDGDGWRCVAWSGVDIPNA
ncbi:histidine phosphatase family protein [Umezawaea sp. Da 62-37]|uniref:histidine phosphatase family protein n=1 Tax=Umezawaea sp. Da 62-37 TaxID=3075927 RepID=UPI0028F71B38|nr:histidine phosphatase family protein [Umezawaea sp. Da 62-37]WNV91553.1 histidine phosphatase family protein [Umezawaea sp. Da 62-37]